MCGHQNRQRVPVPLDASTTPPMPRVVAQPSTLASVISSMSTSQEARAAPPESDIRRLNVDSFDSSDSSDEDVPSPKKVLPDFTMQKSDDNSVASGDDSIAWEKEEDRVLHVFAIPAEAEDALENALEDAPVKELEEWELIAEGGEGTAHEVAAPPQSSLRQEPFN
jgi:hypothetical protein